MNRQEKVWMIAALILSAAILVMGFFLAGCVAASMPHKPFEDPVILGPP